VRLDGNHDFPVHRLLDPRLLLGLEERVVLEGVLDPVALEGHLIVEPGVLALELEVVLDHVCEQRRCLYRHRRTSWKLIGGGL
jgi:hypothetical protein